jgi:hypothetical protein
VTDHDLVLDGRAEELPRPSDVVRLVTADGWVYPYTVAEAEARDGSARIRVVEGPGLTFEAQASKLTQTAFPQREHRGEVRVEWTPRATR